MRIIANFVLRVLHKLLIHADRRYAYQLFTNMENEWHAMQYDVFRKRYAVHPSFRFNGKRILLYGQGQILLGEHSYIGEYSTIEASPGQMVRIGKNCRISHNVRVYTSSLVADQDFSQSTVTQKAGDVIIGDHVWIGANVFVNPGVKIGDNAVIGANSVVISDIPSYSIWGGVPARELKKKKHSAISADISNK